MFREWTPPPSDGSELGASVLAGGAAGGTAASAAGGAGGAKGSAAGKAATAASSDAAGERPPSEVANIEMRDLWGSFFASAVEVGVAAVRAGHLDVDDVECMEPHVYLGLTGLSLLEAAFRSARNGRPGITLASNVLVRRDRCPEEVVEMFIALEDVRDAVREAGFECGHGDESSPEADFLRRTVVAAGSGTEIESPLGEDARVSLRRMAAKVQSVATTVTQLPFFKANFSNVLMDVATRAE